jgi:hypothetical protein
MVSRDASCCRGWKQRQRREQGAKVDAGAENGFFHVRLLLIQINRMEHVGENAKDRSATDAVRRAHQGWPWDKAS